jgi:uncharacterized Zn finger protein
MELLQARHIIDNLCLRRVAAGMIFFRGTDDDVDDIWKASATAATLLHGMIHFGRHDQLPTVLIKEAFDDILDFMIGDVIATTDQHMRISHQT